MYWATKRFFLSFRFGVCNVVQWSFLIGDARRDLFWTVTSSASLVRTLDRLIFACLRAFLSHELWDASTSPSSESSSTLKEIDCQRIDFGCRPCLCPGGGMFGVWLDKKKLRILLTKKVLLQNIFWMENLWTFPHRGDASNIRLGVNLWYILCAA